jgi:hypothetical protein
MGLIACLKLPAKASDYQTDRDFQEVKGPVKKVLAQAYKFTQSDGRRSETPFDFSFAYYFDEKGTITSSERIYKGEVESRTTSFYLAGERVSKTETFVLQNPPPEPSGGGSGKVCAGATDNRYQRKTTYIYDKRGNRIEEIGWNNCGGRNYRKTYDFTGKGKFIETYFVWTNPEKMQMLSQKTYTLNEQGQVKEVSSGNAKHSSRDIYTDYEFDRAGNWVKRTRAHISEADGKETYKSTTLETRKIEYYQ